MLSRINITDMKILNDKDIDTNSRKYYKLVFKTNVWNIIEKIIPVITVLGILAGLAFINGFIYICISCYGNGCNGYLSVD